MAELPIHGDPDALELARLGIPRGAVLDLSVNVSPFGPHPDVERAVRQARIHEYPDRHALDARHALASRLRVDAERIVLGSGAAELIWTAVLACGSGSRLLIVGPTFGEPSHAAAASRISTTYVDMSELDEFDVDRERITVAIARERPDVVYLCHPNNPTGRAMPTRALARLVADHGFVRFLIDQAFLSLSDLHDDHRVRFPDNAFVIRSLTKDHALAGVRLAYGLGSPDFVSALERARPAWTVSAMALAAVRPCVEHDERVATARSTLTRWRREFAIELRRTGVSVVPSTAPFLLVRTGEATSVRAELLAVHHILVRDCTSFGLPDHIRVAARGPDERARLSRALAEVIGS